MTDYQNFLDNKAQNGLNHGFDPLFMPQFLYPFQEALVRWAIIKGRAAIFADTGLGKTPMQLVWAQNIVEKTNKPVLIITPLAVSQQTEREGRKFGVDCQRSRDGKWTGNRIVITNYERLHHFNPDDFGGVVCDESSAIKNYQGARQKIIIEFMRTRPYRLLCTATAAPNDYIELGTSSEALGQLGIMDMLQTFFKSVDDTMHPGTRRYQPIWLGSKWRFKAHAERPFWRWVVSWARALRMPADLGYDNDGFVLPPMQEREHIVRADEPRGGWLFDMPAINLREQREERRLTIHKRCDRVAELVNHKDPVVVWCHMNDEGDILEEIIPGALQVAGKHDDDVKEERLVAFSNGELRALITKPKIGAFGLNWQHCNHMTFFPSHSFEQYYQGTRRCWRYGQKRPVTIDIVTSEGESGVMKNLQRKAKAAEKMFAMLVSEINNELKVDRSRTYVKPLEVPAWLS